MKSSCMTRATSQSQTATVRPVMMLSMGESLGYPGSAYEGRALTQTAAQEEVKDIKKTAKPVEDPEVHHQI